jgi:thiamine kinase-like enzyme
MYRRKLRFANTKYCLSKTIGRKSELIKHYINRLFRFANKNKNNFSDFHITSGDVGGNVIIQGEKFTIIDWDYLKLAPIERDIN